MINQSWRKCKDDDNIDVRYDNILKAVLISKVLGDILFKCVFLLSS